MNGLDDHGWHVGADPQYAYKYGAGHVVAADRAAQSWYVTETSAGSTLTTGLPGARVVAAVTPLSPSEDRELARLQRQFIARMRDTNHMELLPAVDWELAGLAAAGHMDTTGIDVNRLDDLNAKVARSGICRCAVTAEATAIPADRLQLALAIPKDVIRSWR
jgi:hypothetical protein